MLSLKGLIAGEAVSPEHAARNAEPRAAAAVAQPDFAESLEPDATAGETTRMAPRRKSGGIALALGGGAAKGWAHIGLLRAFQEAGIPISMIAGTSIGALVGGCYLAGRLDELERFARSLTRSNIIRYMDFSITGAGLISGMRLAAYMDLHMRGLKIEELPANFVSVCTDIRTGHEIWLHDGPLIEALRASYALPGIFAPVVHAGRHLVDGALVNPVPVSACRAYEPDVVIAADLNSETFGRGTVIRASHYQQRETERNFEEAEQLAAEQPQQRHMSWLSFFTAADRSGSVQMVRAGISGRTLNRPKAQPKSHLGTMGVMMEAFNIIQDRISRARMAGDPPDFTIRPKLFSIGLADFHKADESIRIGYLEAKKRIRELTDQGQLESA
jgi:NTE family protein